MKKICFLISSPFTLGGEQRVVSVLSNALLKQDFDVTILCDSILNYNYDTYNLNKNVKVIELPVIKKSKYKFLNNIYKGLRYINKKTNFFKNNYKILRKIYCNKLIINEILKYANKEKYDYIVGVGGKYSTIVAELKGKTNAKIIGWQHSGFDAYFKTKNRYFWHQDLLFEKSILKLDKYIVLKQDDKNKIDEYFGVESMVFPNPRSFNSDEVSDLKNKNFIAMGRFIYVKGFIDLIEAFRLFNEKNKEWKLQIYGEGEEKDKYLELIKKYNLENYVIINGYTSDVKNVFLNSSVYLMTSRWEGFPMVFLEAFETGVPIISFDIPISREVLNCENGVIVEDRDVNKYAEVMLEFASNSKLLEKYAENAKKSSSRYSQEKICDMWIEMFDNLEK